MKSVKKIGFALITASLLFIALWFALCGFASAQMEPSPTKYWTTQRKLETIGVTALHLGDAGQTCFHEISGHWHETGIGTPRNCPGGAVYLIATGPLIQWTTYRLTRRYPHSNFWARVDHGMPHLEMSISTMAITRTNTGRGANKYGF
jgi:hypothetical protein